MSSSPKTTTTNTTSGPIQGPQGQLYNAKQGVYGSTAGTLKSDLNTPIPQNWVAQATPLQWQGSEAMASAAPGLGQNAQSTMDLSKRISSGYYSNPWNDPNFQGAVSSAFVPLNQNFFGTVLPGVYDSAVRASGGGSGPAAYGGVGGGSPQDINTQRATQALGQTEANTAATMAQNAYGQGLNLMSLVPGLNTSGIATSLAPSLAMTQAGSLQQGYNQSALDNIIKAYQAQTMLPLTFEQQAANIGAAGGFGNKYGTSTGPPPDLATQWLQGLTGGASGLNSLFGAGAGGSPSTISNLFSGLGSAGTAAMGGLSSAGTALAGLFGGGATGEAAAAAAMMGLV